MTATGPVDRNREQREADRGDDGTGDQRREEPHDLDMNGAISMPKNPAAMVAPKIPCRPTPGMPAMATMLPTAAKLAPIITGMRMPTGPIPNDWTMVATPATSRSALIRKATSSRDSPAAWPMIKGTAIAPPYISSTCCRPTGSVGTGAEAVVGRNGDVRLAGLGHAAPRVLFLFSDQAASFKRQALKAWGSRLRLRARCLLVTYYLQLEV